MTQLTYGGRHRNGKPLRPCRPDYRMRTWRGRDPAGGRGFLGILCLLAALVAFAPPKLAEASELSADLAARRAKVMEKLGADAMLILWSAPAQRYSLDIDYEYRQDSNLYYLTGITQEGTMLVMMPGNRSRREILFVKDPDPVQEHWRGRRLTVEEARERTGIATVMLASPVEPFVKAMAGRKAPGRGALRSADGRRPRLRRRSCPGWTADGNCRRRRDPRARWETAPSGCPACFPGCIRPGVKSARTRR